MAVDVYNDSAVIFEYKAPKEIASDVAQKRLQDVITLTAEQLDIDPLNIAVKVRQRQKGQEQYKALDKQNRIEIVEEYGAKFKVNLFDYLDTGLFLDHRLARKYIQQHANGKRVLNLLPTLVRLQSMLPWWCKIRHHGGYVKDLPKVGKENLL